MDENKQHNLDWAEYPLLHQAGMRVNRKDPLAPPGTLHLKECLEKIGKLEAWRRWAGGGITASSNGIYPWDVEAFLEGSPNDD